MKNKFFALMAMAALTTMLALAVSAQSNKKNDPATRPSQPNGPMVKPGGQKVMLTCSPGQGKDVSTPLNVKNPTAQDLPSGTLVYWSAKSGGTANNKQTLSSVLKKNNGNEVSLMGPPGNQASCQAWVIK